MASLQNLTLLNIQASMAKAGRGSGRADLIVADN